MRNCLITRFRKKMWWMMQHNSVILVNTGSLYIKTTRFIWLFRGSFAMWICLTVTVLIRSGDSAILIIQWRCAKLINSCHSASNCMNFFFVLNSFRCWRNKWSSKGLLRPRIHCSHDMINSYSTSVLRSFIIIIHTGPVSSCE